MSYVDRGKISCERRVSRGGRGEEEGAKAFFLRERRRSRRLKSAMREQLD
jgi:hypothetical protein